MNPDDEVVVGVETGVEVGVGVDTALADMGISISTHGRFNWQTWALYLAEDRRLELREHGESTSLSLSGHGGMSKGDLNKFWQTKHSAGSYRRSVPTS